MNCISKGHKSCKNSLAALILFIHSFLKTNIWKSDEKFSLKLLKCISPIEFIFPRNITLVKLICSINAPFSTQYTGNYTAIDVNTSKLCMGSTQNENQHLYVLNIVFLTNSRDITLIKKVLWAIAHKWYPFMCSVNRKLKSNKVTTLKFV